MEGRRMAGARALWIANGMKPEQMGKPVIAVVNSFTQFVPGHTHLHKIGQEVKAEIHRLVIEGFLTQEQGALVNPEKLARFFRTEPGRKLLAGAPCLREFKFSILDDGSHYGEGLEGERVLLQGVVDCALLEPEGITVIDFKTDRVTEETIHTTADRYSLQVQTYADALSRIYEMPVKRKMLYFFSLDTFYEL